MESQYKPKQLITMKEPRKMVENVQGYGLIVINVFFSTKDAYTLHEFVGILTQYRDKISSPEYDGAVDALTRMSDMILNQFYTPSQPSVFDDNVQ